LTVCSRNLKRQNLIYLAEPVSSQVTAWPDWFLEIQFKICSLFKCYESSVFMRSRDKQALWTILFQVARWRINMPSQRGSISAKKLTALTSLSNWIKNDFGNSHLKQKNILTRKLRLLSRWWKWYHSSVSVPNLRLMWT
jgi:hypothetical protein